MPNPSGPNVYPSSPGNYPSAPNTWTAGATTKSTSTLTTGPARVIVRAAVALSSSATLTATVQADRPVSVNLLGGSTIVAAATATVGATATLTATSALFADLSATLVATSSLDASAAVEARAQVAVTATSSVSAQAGRLVSATVTLIRSVSAVAADAQSSLPVQAFIDAESDTTVDARKGSPGSVPTILATSSLAAAAFFFTPAFPTPAGRPIPQVQVPKLALLVADTVTGKVAYSAPFTDVSWSCPLNKEGTASATLVVQDVLEAIYEQGDRDPATSLNEFLTGPYRYSFAVAWGARVLWAGPYLPSSDPPDAPTVSVAGASFRRMMDRRIVRNFAGSATGDPGDPSRDLKLVTTAQGAALQLVQNALTGNDPYGRTRSLPVSCSVPPDTRGDEVFTFLSYDVMTVSKALDELSKRAGDGPDIRFDPYLYAGDDGSAYLAYDLKVGNPTIDGYGTLGPSGPSPWVWDDGLHPISRDVDAAGLATSVWATGSGQDRAKLIATAANDYLPSLGWPVLEVADAGQQSETDKNKLGLRAAGMVGSDPAVTWKAAMRYEDEPPIGMFREGDLARIDIRRHPLIRPGPYLRRITQVSGSATGVSVDFDNDD